jgi:DNA replication and repair protein RecF
LLVGLHLRNDTLLGDLDRILRQRSALLRQAGGRLTPEIGFTLDVWDAKLAATGTALAAARVDALERLAPHLARAYRDVASPGESDEPQSIGVRYASPWWGTDGGLAAALIAARADEVRRGACLVGPHRDEVALVIDGRPSRTHASQGEQRTLALALRLAAHRLVTEAAGTAPLLLLDDVFSELDPRRSDALVRHLPPGQSLLATAGAVPGAALVGHTVRIARRTDHGSLVSAPTVDNPGDSVEESAWKRVR